MKASPMFSGTASFTLTIIAAATLCLMLPAEPVRAQQIFATPSGYSACAIDAKGNLYVWGCDNYNRTVVSARTPQDLTPVKVSFPSGVTSWKTAAVGAYYTLALGNDGNIYGWGYNGYGELGDGNTNSTGTFVKVELPDGVTAWTAVAAGDSFNLAIGNNGILYSWGANSQGQLGNGTTTSSTTPVEVSLPSGVRAAAIAAGEQFAAVIGSDGKVYVWGTNDNGQLGTGSSKPSYSDVPLTVSLPSGITPMDISTGRSYFLVIGSDGNIYGWGGNSAGQLDNSATFGTLVYSPVIATKPSGVTSWNKAVGGGEGFSLGIANTGAVYAWGYNGLGELGVGNITATKAASDTAHAVDLPNGITGIDIATADYSDFALGAEGDTVYAWGYNAQGELGINKTTTDELKPVEVLGAGGVGYLALSGALTAPTLVSPDGIAGVPRLATMIWDSTSGATEYQLQVATGNQFYFSALVVDTTLSDTSVTLSAPLAANTKYYWRVIASNSLFSTPYSAIDSFKTGTGIEAVNYPSQTPNEFTLFQNYPNPFNPTTVIGFNFPSSGFVSLKVYDIIGREVATLVDGRESRGYHSVRFNAGLLSSGVYFYRITAGKYTSVKKLMLVK